MSWLGTILLVLIALFGAPLFAVFGAGSMLGFSVGDEGVPVSAAASDVFGEKFATSIMLVTIPLFTFGGYLMAESKAPTRLVNVARAWLGWIPGGIPMVALGSCAFFTAFTGGSGITIVAIGGLLYPALRSVKYSEKFSLGMITTGGSLGLLFPPSVPVILFAVVASNITSELYDTGILVEKLFLAGALPGVLTVAALWAYAILAGKRARMARTPFVLAEAIRATREALWEVVLPPLLVLGIVLGWLRIHEAAAFTAAYVLVVEVAVYRDIALKDLARVIREAMTLVGAIMAILVTAIGFTWYLVYAQVPDKILGWAETLIAEPWAFSVLVGLIALFFAVGVQISAENRVFKRAAQATCVAIAALAIVPLETWGLEGHRDTWTFLLMLNLFLIVVGMMMDIFSAIVVVVPLVLPLARHYHVDPYHLGIVFLLNLEIGYLTPPVGLNLFIASFRFGRPVTVLYRAVLPFIAVLCLALLVTTYVPWLSTWSGEVEIPPDEPTGEETNQEAPIGDDPESEDGLSLEDLENDLGGEPSLEELENELNEGSALDDIEDELGEPEPDSENGSGGSALEDLEQELDEP